MRAWIQLPRALALVVIVGTALGACQSDPFCRAHNAASYAPTKAAWDAMAPAERRAAASRFDEAARRCGWEP